MPRQRTAHADRLLRSAALALLPAG